MTDIGKLLVISCFFFLLVGGVGAYDGYVDSFGEDELTTYIEYSEPTYNNGSKIEWSESKPSLMKNNCPRDEWNENFEDYRNGIISKEEMKKYIGGCKW